MLNELESLQESDETLSCIEMSFDIETRSEDGEEIVHREYFFSYAKEWDKWTFTEFVEKRTSNTDRISERNWRKSRHIYWEDDEAPSVDVPPEVSEALEEATGAETVTIQGP